MPRMSDERLAEWIDQLSDMHVIPGDEVLTVVIRRELLIELLGEIRDRREAQPGEK